MRPFMAICAGAWGDQRFDQSGKCTPYPLDQPGKDPSFPKAPSKKPLRPNFAGPKRYRQLARLLYYRSGALRLCGESHDGGEIAQKHQYTLDVVQDLIRRIHQSEYKRRQGAPGLRISEKSFSVGYRFPIVQGWI